MPDTATATATDADRRPGSRLAVDDRRYCKICGWRLPDVLVFGPVAGGDSDTPATELCGQCAARELLK